MKASIRPLSFAKWLRLMTLLTVTGTLVPMTGYAVNHGATSPPGEDKGTCDAGSDEQEDADAEEGSDCAGGCDSQNDPNQPSPGKCIKEEIKLAIAPNEPGLGDGKIKLYIDHTGSNLGSRDHLEFFGAPQMSITEVSPKTDLVELGIVQAGGTQLRFSLPAVKAAGADHVAGRPIGESGYSLARLSYVDLGGSFAEKATAQAIRQYRSGGGFVDYPLVGGCATALQTKQGRVYNFPLNQVEIIREKPDGTYSVNGNYGQGLIRQVKTVAGMLDIVPLSDRSYEVRKYAPQQLGAKVNGLFTTTSAPFFTMKVEAPVGTQNSLIITKTEGSLSSVTNHTITMNGSSETWLQVVSCGGVQYKRSLIKEPVSELGAGYRRSKWDSGIDFLPDGVGVGVRGGGGGGGGGGGQTAMWDFGKEMISYKNSMVSSTQSFSTGKTTLRDRTSCPVPWDTNAVGRVQTQKTSTGTSIGYGYDPDSARMTERTKLCVMPLPGGGGGSAIQQRKETFSYSAVAAGDSVGFADFKPRSTVVAFADVVDKASYFAAKKENGEYRELKAVTCGGLLPFDDPTNVRQEKVWYGPGEHQGRLKQELKEDGTLERYEYAAKPNNALEVTTYKRLDPSGNPVSGYSTRVRELRDARAWPVETTTAAWTGSAWVDYETIYQTRNEAGRLTAAEREDKLSGQRRMLLQQEWDGPRLTRKVDEMGIATSYEYFSGTTLVKTARREAIPAAGNCPAQPEIVTTYTGTFTMNDKQVPEWKTRTTTITGGDLTLTEQETFDEKGRVVSHTDKNGYTTTTVYSEDDKVKTKTLPDGGTRITREDSEGRVLSITGTAVVPEFHHYFPRAQGGIREIVYTGVDNGPRYEIIDKDGADRVVRKAVPAFGGGESVTTFTYSLVHPQSVVKVTRTGQATKICELNGVGECVREGLSADDATLTLGSATDRITDKTTTVESDAGGLWQVVRDSVYPETGGTTAKVVKTTRRKLGGLSGTEIERTETADIAGNITTERELLNGTVCEERVARPGITGEEVAIRHGKRLMSLVRPGIAGETAFGYDALGRNVSRKEPRHTQASTKTYLAGTSLLASQADAAGNATGYSYYPQGAKGAGKVKAITLPDNSVKWTAYTLLGNPMAEWGSQTYPTWREYDAYGQLITLRTWQTAPTLDADTLPATAPAGAAVTTWNYDAGTGLLANKRYADGKGPDYSYDAARRLHTRLWARSVNGSRLATTYAWNGFGQLTAVDYADDTPDVAIAYDRIGRITSQGNGVSVSAFTYSPATLRLSSEGITYDLDRDGTPELTRQLDRSQDAYLRPAGYQLKNGATVETQASYGYDTAGRLDTVNGGDLGAFTYGYISGSSLIGTVTGPVHAVANIWEPNRAALVEKSNKVGDVVVSDHQYETDSIGRRVSLSQFGSAFNVARDITWGYDDIGQLVSEDSSEDAHDRSYLYDSVGNRKRTSNSLFLPNEDNYVVNAVNQYQSDWTGQQSTSPSYDYDGNAVSYPLPASNNSNLLRWDAEGRLASVMVASGSYSYVYDIWGRRIAKVTPMSTRSFIYDGLNIISDYEDGGLCSRKLWGLDLTGSIQGGGVGALLSLREGADVFYSLFDGNGNVSEYLSGDGSLAGHVEYDGFGLVKVQIGVVPRSAVLFSSKELDAETGLYFYGQRYYEPASGRWLSRDPLKEQGSLNVYTMVFNSPTNYFDPNGQFAQALACFNPVGALIVGGVLLADLAIRGEDSVLGQAANAISDAIEGAADALSDALSDPSGADDEANTPTDPGAVDCPNNQPPFTGTPGSTVRGGTGSRTYGEDGYPETDRDYPHGGGPEMERGDHAHDWGRPEGGGPPTGQDRGPARPPRAGDPPPPRGPNVPPPQA